MFLLLAESAIVAAPSTAQPGGACVRGITICQGGSGCVNDYCVCADGQMVSTLFQCTDAAQVDTNAGKRGEEAFVFKTEVKCHQ